MSKVKLVEMVNNNNSEVIEDLNYVKQPNFQITDVTVLPDEEYRPTIQNILINLEEGQRLHETQSSKLGINILSETVNEKTGYSSSLFEFESSDSTITLSLALTESSKYNGVYNVAAYTTKGEKVFETNTQCPERAVQKYLCSLSETYLIKESTLLPNDESKEDLEQSKFETLDACVREALQYSGDIGQELRTKDIYIDLVKEGDYKISEKQSNKTVAIITPDNNVYELKLTEIINQDDNKELKSDDKDNAKAPKEVKELNAEPKELDDLKEAEDTKWKVEITVNGELTYYSRMTAKDIQEVLSLANSIEPNQEFAESDDSKFLKSNEVTVKEADEEDPSVDDVKEEINNVNSAYFIRKPADIHELEDKISKNLVSSATYSIVKEHKLPQDEFDAYLNDLRQSKDFLKEFKPNPTNADFTCIAVSSESGPTLLIDNSGYDSAQYVGIL